MLFKTLGNFLLFLPPPTTSEQNDFQTFVVFFFCKQYIRKQVWRFTKIHTFKESLKKTCSCTYFFPFILWSSPCFLTTIFDETWNRARTALFFSLRHSVMWPFLIFWSEYEENIKRNTRLEFYTISKEEFGVSNSWNPLALIDKGVIF